MNEELKNKLTERFDSAYGEEVKIGLREALRKVYLDGVEHGYQYAIEKACEWITNYFVNYLQFDKQIVSDFRKAMEE